MKHALLKKGFTLIELLIVIGIIAILAGIVLVSINPAAQFERAQNTERIGSSGDLVKAFYAESASPSSAGTLTQCSYDDGGGGGVQLNDLPDCGVNFAGALELGTPGSATAMDCSAALVPSYVREMPVDPDNAFAATNTGYSACLDNSGATPLLYILSLGSAPAEDGECQHPDGVSGDVLCVSG